MLAVSVDTLGILWYSLFSLGLPSEWEYLYIVFNLKIVLELLDLANKSTNRASGSISISEKW